MRRAVLGMVLLSMLMLQGCVIGFPPLVNVESSKKAEENNNKEVMKRLDAIDKRLSQIEQEQKAEKKP